MSSFGLEPHAIAALVTTLGALILFTRERIPLEYSCLVILCVLVIGFEAVPFERAGQSVGAVEFLAGFGNEALITICLLLMLAKGVEVSGALRPLGRRYRECPSRSKRRRVQVPSSARESSVLGR